MKMLERLDDYDWQHAFGCAGKENSFIGGTPERAIPGDNIDVSPFDREDVEEIIAIDDGENDGESWIGVFKLKDGRYASINAGCDFTGWD